MEKNTVTRTISFGAISSGTKAARLDDFSTARRHSSAGIRALLWATSRPSAASLGSCLGSESQTSRDNIFTNVLTPDSIPQFTIPNLSVQTGLRSSESNREPQREDDDEDEGLGSPRAELESSLSTSSAGCTLSPSASSTSVFSLSDRKAGRSISDPLTSGRSLLKRDVSFPGPYMEAQDCLDPASRAALSLPHLTKVTTPYGFVTLSQSPQMASEEALLCQAGLRRLNKDEGAACFYRKASLTRTADVSIIGTSLDRSAAKQRLSKNVTSSQAGGLPRGEMNPATTASVSSSSTPKQATDSRRKHRFWEVIRKHLTSHHKE